MSATLALAQVGDALGQFFQLGTLLSVVLDGLSKAALYVMLASGLTLIFGLMGVLNFAHGSLTMIGAYLGGLLMVVLVSAGSGPWTRVGYFLVAAVVVLVALSALGAGLEVTLIRPLYDRPPIYQILLTFGVTLVLDEVVRIIVAFYGLQPISDWQAALGTKPAVLSRTHDLTAVGVGSVSALSLGVGVVVALLAWAALVRYRDGAAVRVAADGGFVESVADRADTSARRVARALVAGTALIVGSLAGLAVGAAALDPVEVTGLGLFEIWFGVLTVAVVWAFLTRTRYGLVVRAGSEDAEMTQALGIDVRRVFTTVFALGAGVAGVAGVLLAWDPTWGASVPLATESLLPAFVVVIIGGLGTFRGTVFAGLLVGLVDAVTTWWFVNAIDFASLPEMTIFLILVVMLVIRPQGLFGRAEVGGH